jgi:hypothetical protein
MSFIYVGVAVVLVGKLRVVYHLKLFNVTPILFARRRWWKESFP